MPRFNKACHAGVLSALLSGGLIGCSQAYLDRRDTINLGAGNAAATNAVTHMVDPWPRESGDTLIAFNGQKMQSAVERYRTNQVIPPRGTATATTYGQTAAPAAAPTGGGSAPVGPTVTQSSTK
jgi:hypothetical protein